jgi:hypothetical protein
LVVPGNVHEGGHQCALLLVGAYVVDENVVIVNGNVGRVVSLGRVDFLEVKVSDFILRQQGLKGADECDSSITFSFLTVPTVPIFMILSLLYSWGLEKN